MDERFAVSFTPLPTAARVTRQRRALRWRIGTTIVSLIILAVILIWFRPDWSALGLGIVIALWVGSSVFWLIVNIVGLQRAKRDLGRIQTGVCFHINPEGIEFLQPTHVAARWGEIERIHVAGGSGGAGLRFAVDAAGRTVAEVPLSFLDAGPAVLDSMIRAFSLGKHHLKACRLESSV